MNKLKVTCFHLADRSLLCASFFMSNDVMHQNMYGGRPVIVNDPILYLLPNHSHAGISAAFSKTRPNEPIS